VRNSYLSIFSLLFFVLFSMGIASAQTFTNGSFETGDFTGWQTSGTPAVLGGPSVVAGGAPTPPSGSFQALLNSTGASGSGAPDIYAFSNSVTAATLNTFLATTLPGNANGAAQDGEAIQQTFSTTNGATITFSYAYESREIPGNGYDETGYVLNGVFHILADTNTPNQSSANHTEFLTGGTVYQTVKLTVGPGVTKLGFVAYNTGNTSAPSGLFVDNVVVTPLQAVSYATLDVSTANVPTVEDTFANAVSGNNVAGSFFGTDNFTHGYFYNGSSGTYTAFDPADSTGTQVNGLSADNVVGSYTDSTTEHGFLYNVDTNTDTVIDPPGSSLTVATAISGTRVVGWFIDAGGQHGFLYDNSTGNYTVLDPTNSSPSNNTTTATAVSSNGVVGYFQSTIDGATHGFLFDGTNYTTIDPSGSQLTQATGISGNNVVGIYVNGEQQHGFVYNIASTAYVSAIDPPTSLTNNAFTTVTGVSGNNMAGYFQNSAEHGFLYETDNATFTSPLDPPLSVDTEIDGVSGDNVVGTYQDSGGAHHGFLAGVNKTTTPVTLGTLFTVWSGVPQPVTATTNPSNVNVVTTYTGVNVSYPTSTTPPTAVGSYTVLATVVDPNYSGSAGGTLVIGKATPAIDLSNLSPTYDGTAKAVTVTTNPGVINIIVTYSSQNDSSYPSSTTPPTAADTYGVIAMVDPADPHYTGSNAGILVINQATASVSQPTLTTTFTGAPKPVTATTNPAGLSLAYTYSGSTYSATASPPSAVGTYTVVATITDPNYQGSNTGTLTINGSSSTVAFSDWESSFPNSGSFTDRAAADSPFHDGVPNALKYLFNIDPTVPMTIAQRAKLPALDTVTLQGTEYLTLTFHEYANQSGVNVTVQRSNDLQTWSSTSSNASDFFLQVLETDQTTGDLIVEAGVAVNAPKTFIRLNVSGP
jgi:MBG domain